MVSLGRLGAEGREGCGMHWRGRQGQERQGSRVGRGVAGPGKVRLDKADVAWMGQERTGGPRWGKTMLGRHGVAMSGGAGRGEDRRELADEARAVWLGREVHGWARQTGRAEEW